MRNWKPIVVVTALALIAANATAQQAYTFWSAEALAIRARCAFRGVVVDVETPPSEPNTNPQIAVTVRVDAVLKGVPGKTVTFDGNLLGVREARFNLWKASKTEFLWFDLGGDGNDQSADTTVRGLSLHPFVGQHWQAIRLSPMDPKEAELGNSGEALTSGTFSMALGVYPQSKDLFGRLKQFLAKEHGHVSLVEFMIPSAMAKLVGYDAGSDRLVIPVAPESEALMRKVIESPGSVLGQNPSQQDETWIRSECVRVLSFFRSEKNVILLKSLLTDPGRGPWYHVPYTPEAAENTYYWTRLAAYDVLTLWGITVTKPNL